MYESHGGVPAPRPRGSGWRKSRRSNSSGSCVELSAMPDGSIAVRDSRAPGGPTLVYTRTAMMAFLQDVKDGGSGVRSAGPQRIR
ncbi:DUF397 domain-containing protein [Actinomadura scrupuli]|uniref:DUF397 domain-containing protein n=1 Tax=Actinomadura scrupuli TaxID=559629 RepID=UPI003D990BF7